VSRPGADDDELLREDLYHLVEVRVAGGLAALGVGFALLEHLGRVEILNGSEGRGEEPPLLVFPDARQDLLLVLLLEPALEDAPQIPLLCRPHYHVNIGRDQRGGGAGIN